MEQVQQLFFDRGEKSFLSEIISIFRPISIHIDIRSETVITQFIWPEGKKVRLRFVGDIPGNLISVRTYVSYGRSYGECLYLCRKKIREETGQ